MNTPSVLLIVGALALFALWCWVKNRNDDNDIDDGDAPALTVGSFREAMGFHRPQVTTR